MAHKVSNLTISCIDFRFRAGVAEWIRKSLDDQSDIVALAGSSQAILLADTQPSILKQIKLAKQLHDIKTVHIVDHLDCGAYGGSAKFDNDKGAEIAMHEGELAKAKDAIGASFPDISVETHIIDFGGMI
jgi:carbonic anhydrase